MRRNKFLSFLFVFTFVVFFANACNGVEQYLSTHTQERERANAYEFYALFFGKGKWAEKLFDKMAWEPTMELVATSISGFTDYVEWPNTIERLRSLNELREKVEELFDAPHVYDRAEVAAEEIAREIGENPFTAENTDSLFNCVYLSRLQNHLNTECFNYKTFGSDFIQYQNTILVLLNERDYRENVDVDSLLKDIERYYQESKYDKELEKIQYYPEPVANDHIIRELEFMAYLLRKSGDTCGNMSCYQMAENFFKDHIAPWLVEDFGEDYDFCYPKTFPGKAAWAAAVLQDYKFMREHCGQVPFIIPEREATKETMVSFLSHALQLDAFLLKECREFQACAQQSITFSQEEEENDQEEALQSSVGQEDKDDHNLLTLLQGRWYISIESPDHGQCLPVEAVILVVDNGVARLWQRGRFIPLQLRFVDQSRQPGGQSWSWAVYGEAPFGLINLLTDDRMPTDVRTPIDFVLYSAMKPNGCDVEGGRATSHTIAGEWKVTKGGCGLEQEGIIVLGLEWSWGGGEMSGYGGITTNACEDENSEWLTSRYWHEGRKFYTDICGMEGEIISENVIRDVNSCWQIERLR